MLSWLWNWWWWSDDYCDAQSMNNNDDDDDNVEDNILHKNVNGEFNYEDYKKYSINVVDKQTSSHFIKWDTFKCGSKYNFNYRYIDKNQEKYYNIIDFCKGLKIKHDDVLDCSWNDDEHVYYLDEIIFNKKRHGSDNIAPASLGSLFATQEGLRNVLIQFNFAHKNRVLWRIQTAADIYNGIDDDNDNDYKHKNLRDKIDSVLEHVQKLNANSEKFLQNHELFKNKVNDKFEQFEERLHELNVKLNTIQSAENVKMCLRNKSAVASSSSPINTSVVFPRDTTKHQHLAVFSERNDDGLNTTLAFVSGQEQHFRKRKLRYEDTMETLYDGVHPNPLLAIQCINEHLYDKNYKIKKLARRVIDVNCNFDAIKEIVQNVL
ncbi:38.7k protein [Catopsilia pomona nucleopolyhedrovirus]|uniref:38.7k protein n=1 Tax=Catopsilia pomona nucleopolyhedrovirus TaxID=1850906 RepID=A0A172WZK0_9ABAC|nr:38.7k protein [Catopsilia pomona nucleopolyhedrovirus]ANF29773.1 38.7k protein [Catopsilia pomona nucleopolyhedrovirus]